MTIRRIHLALVSAALFACATLMAGPRDAAWAKVREAEAQQLPKTAIALLEPIITAAQAEGAYPEATRAIVEKIELESTLMEGNRGVQEGIVRLQAEIAKAPEAMKPAMTTLLAHFYWQFFQQNRWRFHQRTASTANNADLLTWDLNRILTEIDRQFDVALANEKTLQATPIESYLELIEEGSAPRIYRPTLYDFLVYEALSFYQAGEQGAKIAEDSFVIDASSPIFASVSDFLEWKPASPDSGYAPALRAITLYQGLLAFHSRDKDRSAFYDADLARLVYARNIAVGEDKEARFKAALERFIDQTSRHEISARAQAILAQQLKDEGEPLKARALAQKARKAFPQSSGAKECANLILELEAKSAEVETEYVWSAPWPTIDVTYRNTSKVYFRAVSADFLTHLQDESWYNDQRRKQILEKTPALSWNSDLPSTRDLKERTEQLPVPKNLKPGFYYLIASFDSGFSTEDNQLSITPFWVSKLATVTEASGNENPNRGWVLESESGNPVSGATVRFLQRDQTRPFNARTAYINAGTATTDEQGAFALPSVRGPLIILAEQGGHTVASSDPFYQGYRGGTDDGTSHTLFFTDRSLYRPGQSIHYKGIAVTTGKTESTHRVLSNEVVTVVFRDANGKQIAQAEHRTNDYGSFHGVFTAPSSGLTGEMTISTSDPRGFTHISVEEYKRPKFQVEISPPEKAPKLGSTVTVPGKATSYSGVGIGNAMIKWRVTRVAQMPSWCWWWRPAQEHAIAHGTSTTAADGSFSVEFIAKPDLTIPEKNEPVFAFRLTADITDSTGETRSAQRTLRAGYAALQVSVSNEEWQTPQHPVTLNLSTQSLDGDPQSAEGIVRLYTLKQPAKVERASLGNNRRYFSSKEDQPTLDPSNPESWENGKEVAQQRFSSNSDGIARVDVKLSAGIYRAIIETKDRFGKTSTARTVVTVIDPSAPTFTLKVPNHVSAESWSLQPGQTFTALWGTGYQQGRAFIEVESDGKALQSYWTNVGRNQEIIRVPVTETLRGGFVVKITSIRENRAYFHSRIVEVPWKNKELTVTWETFRSKLAPGQKETWTAVVKGPDAQQAVAEVVAAMYDASLDQFKPHNWPQAVARFRQETPHATFTFTNSLQSLATVGEWYPTLSRPVNWSYPEFHPDIKDAFQHRNVVELSAFNAGSAGPPRPSARNTMLGARAAASASETMLAQSDRNSKSALEGEPPQNLEHVQARRNLNETAFFFPQLVSSNNGEVRLEFTMPEALTEWRMFGFAHDKSLRSGFFTGKAVTSKDLMVEPNPPRFVREGDELEFTVKVSNKTTQAQTGNVRLTFSDAFTLKPVDEALANQMTEQSFEVPANQSRSYAWKIKVSDDLGPLAFKAVASTGSLSDGEEGVLPVLSRRILVTESLPLPIRGKTEKTFDFAKLSQSAASPTLRHQSLTVQMTSQPAWYAVMALPYLMEFPHECSEQIFNRYYANALASHIATSDPKIQRVFDLWKNTPALDSPLEKNQELKSLLIEETPWLRRAKNESEARRNLALLFDRNRLNNELAKALGKLTQQQQPNGLWPWFSGGPDSHYISLYVTTGFGRLRQLGAKVDTSAALKSLTALDAWIAEEMARVQRLPGADDYVPSYLDALYLYGRSFFLKDAAISDEHRPAIDFLLKQARKGWTKLNSRQSHAHLALGLTRFGDKTTAQAIAKSLTERAVNNEETGMHWRDTQESWWWYQAPIETQAMMIEVFAEVTNDKKAVEDCQVWLLKQKQTQNWRTTKATADAIYALLMRGSSLLSSDALVQVSLGGETLRPETVEAGTGFYEKTYAGSEVNSAMGEIVVKKTDNGISWGGVHWQYLESIEKVTPHTGTPLTLKKALYVRETTARGPELKPVTGPLAVGDELVVRLELRVDRDMEYLHLKDQRGSGTEPVNVLSHYKYQDRLSYYESTRDAATHFFIERLNRGTYVFEYPVRIQLRGTYQSGIAEIQCMYAPEFNSHSESTTIQVD